MSDMKHRYNVVDNSGQLPVKAVTLGVVQPSEAQKELNKALNEAQRNRAEKNAIRREKARIAQLRVKLDAALNRMETEKCAENSKRAYVVMTKNEILAVIETIFGEGATLKSIGKADTKLADSIAAMQKENKELHIKLNKLRGEINAFWEKMRGI